MKKRVFCSFLSILVLLCSLAIVPLSVSAEEEEILLPGKVYEFIGESPYVFHDAESVSASDEGAKTYGTFSLSGNIANTSRKEGFSAYGVENGTIKIHYKYDNELLEAPEDAWHLVDDSEKTIGDAAIDEKIMKGAIIIQTSKDGKLWLNDTVYTNRFNDVPVNSESIFETSDVQLVNGCYYRISVAYKTDILVEEGSFLYIFSDNTYESRRYAEVYEFYAYDVNNTKNKVDMSQMMTKSLGQKIRTEDSGYSGSIEIDIDDVHFGWDIGNFFVSGYTREATDENGNPVFLKNVGDQVTLWFRLKQDLNRLNGKENLLLAEDNGGYDQQFEIPKTNLGKGALIIQFTDHQGIKHEPTIYTNYLEANTSFDADTIVQLFEEGDYEIALDYMVMDDGLVFDDYYCYRIAFQYSVRNGNCMVYPFDVLTGEELANSATTENGFRLDLAKSRYLDINIKKEVLREGAEGLTEDPRFNRPAKDGDEYTEEGIYTITVNNKYTNQETTKKIYVGTNKLLKASMENGLSVDDIEKLLAQGATISDEGKIIMPEQTPQTEVTSGEKEDKADSSETASSSEEKEKTSDEGNRTPAIPIAIGAVAIVAAGGFAASRRKGGKSTETVATKPETVTTEQEPVTTEPGEELQSEEYKKQEDSE